MQSTGKLIVTTPTDREIAITRVFDATRRLVYDAWTKPELLKRWLGAFGGWTMPICEIKSRLVGVIERTLARDWRRSEPNR